MDSLISVIVPVYNPVQGYLEQAIDSILNQSYRDFEIIVVDDGSISDIKAILGERLNKVRYIRQINAGPAAARNIGLKCANGTFIAFLDADDIWISTKLELQLAEMLRSPGLGLVGCNCVFINENSEIVGEWKPVFTGDKEMMCKMLKKKNTIGTPSTVMIRRECLETIGLFDENIKGTEDRDMWYRIAGTYKVSALNIGLIRYRTHTGNLHKNVDVMKLAQKNFINKHYTKKISFDKLKAYGYLYLDAAREFNSADEYIKSIINALFSIICFPFKLSKDDDKYKIFIKSFLRKKKLAKHE